MSEHDYSQQSRVRPALSAPHAAGWARQLSTWVMIFGLSLSCTKKRGSSDETDDFWTPPQTEAPPRQTTPAPSTRNPTPEASVATIYDLSEVGSNTNRDLLSLAHAFDAFGVPYRVTSDWGAAIAAEEMLFVAGDLSQLAKADRAVAATELVAWAARAGHTLWLSAPTDPELLAGLEVEVASGSTKRDKMLVKTGAPLARYLDTPEEQELWLPGVGAARTAYVQSTSYKPIAAAAAWSLEPAATYADGEAAVIALEHRASGGRAVVFGATFGDLLFRMQYMKHNGHTRGDVNVYEPGADTVRLMIRDGYESWAKAPELRRFAKPEGKKAAVILTHDMDGDAAFVALRDAIMPLEAKHGARSTIFATTSYRKNGWIGAVFNQQNNDVLRAARAAGFDIQSHSVSHLPDMGRWPDGEPNDDPSTYQPSYDPATKTSTGGSLLPELLISARLLAAELDVTTRGWRAGHMAMPHRIGALLEQTDYYYASNATMGSVGGALPYLLIQDQSTADSGEPTGVLQVPVSLADDRIDERPADETLRIWIEITTKNAANNAPTVLLLHPSKDDAKYNLFAKYLEHVARNPDLWITSLDEWYAWYREQGLSAELAQRD